MPNYWGTPFIAAQQAQGQVPSDEFLEMQKRLRQQMQQAPQGLLASEPVGEPFPGHGVLLPGFGPQDIQQPATPPPTAPDPAQATPTSSPAATPQPTQTTPPVQPMQQVPSMHGNAMLDIIEAVAMHGDPMQAAQMFAQYQRHINDPSKGTVGSPLKLGSGNFGYMGPGGQVHDTGTPFHDPLKTIQTDAGVFGYRGGDRGLGTLISPEQLAEGQMSAEDVKIQAEARRRLPSVASETEGRLGLIDKLLFHPAMEQMTGFGSQWHAVMSRLSSDQRTDFNTSLEQLTSQNFMASLKKLKEQDVSLGNLNQHEVDAMIQAASNLRSNMLLDRPSTETMVRELNRLRDSAISYQNRVVQQAKYGGRQHVNPDDYLLDKKSGRGRNNAPASNRSRDLSVDELVNLYPSR